MTVSPVVHALHYTSTVVQLALMSIRQGWTEHLLRAQLDVQVQRHSA